MNLNLVLLVDVVETNCEDLERYSLPGLVVNKFDVEFWRLLKVFNYLAVAIQFLIGVFNVDARYRITLSHLQLNVEQQRLM